jgi:hypothetical protein
MIGHDLEQNLHELGWLHTAAAECRPDYRFSLHTHVVGTNASALTAIERKFRDGNFVHGCVGMVCEVCFCVRCSGERTC